MTKTNHAFAVLLAAVMFAALWVPTLAVPQAQASIPAAELA